ncbi:hypothetical protein ABVE12_20875 [Xanthomonas euvesicatoria]|uniref:Arc family DNA-binding protein n=1 Tax=Xanthomonas euvesicatoria pv. euvesicatoria TaxID=2753541 RepID=A0ABS8LGE0_XANEU|nr:hypothetical protein [Xanthomonas euvesicatoria]MCC8633425.1 hypothetical protein [Xanthomonas euvesicatoria pv. euvesicatoria]
MTDTDAINPAPSDRAGPAPMVLVSLRLPANYRQQLMIKAAQETTRRGKRVSVNTLILEAIEVTHALKGKS